MLALLCALWVAACATSPVASRSEALFNDHLFLAPSERISADDVFALSDDMRRFLQREIAGRPLGSDDRAALIDAIYVKGQLKLEYDSTMTRNAAQAFATRSGNCLSLVIMTATFAKDAPKREFFGNVLQPGDEDRFKGPDGMKFGADGCLYCTVYGQKNITVLDTAGAVAERLPLDGRNPTNCAFALTGTTLLVTEVSKGRVETIPTPCAGLPLHRPKLGLI